MAHIFYVAVLVIIGSLFGIPMTRKPLSEDDGNWFYLPVFWKRGVRLYKNYSGIFGYFGFSQIASTIYNWLGFEKLRFFYFLKSVWYALTAVSIYLLSFFLMHDYVFAFVAGTLFLIITAVPNTLFVLTYGEHFFILPINLSILFTYYGLVTGSFWYFTLAGLMSAWAVQMKPTALLFGILLPTVFYFTPNIYLSLGSYVITFVGLSLLPLIILNNKKSRGKYVLMNFAPIFSFLVIILDCLKLEFLTKYIPESLRAHSPYIENHHNKSLQIQWVSFKRFMFPAIKDLYLILMLAATQILFLFTKFDPFAFSMVLLFIIFLLMQQFQKNYYTPHFNPCWAPISILAAKTVWDMWPYLLNSGALGWVMIVFIGVESIKIGSIIIKSFSKSERDTFGYLGFGPLFRLPEVIGQYIQENSKENDKLFVWGDQPSIYLYAKREAANTEYLFTYSHTRRIHDEKEAKKLLDSLRGKPPELLLFYNYTVNDGWNINRLQESIGIPYNFSQSFKIADKQRKTPENPQGIIFDFPLYRRDDVKYKEILLDRALIARKNKNIDEARTHLKSILEISPEDYEISVWLSLLGNNESDFEKSRRYLEEELSKEHDAVKRSILLRLLADVDTEVGDSDGAKEKYEKALDYNTKDFRIYNGLGELYFSKGNTEKAIQLFEKAFDLNRYSADTLNNMGVVSVTLGKREEAIKIFEKALSFMPSHPVVINNLKALDCSQSVQ